MPDSLNARMAEALAPVLGEAAVYTYTFECPVCRATTAGTSNLPVYCSEIHGGRTVWMTCDTKPVTFADPAVGWGVLERYLKATSSYLTLDHNTEGSVFEAHVFPDLAYQFVHEGYADTAWGAVIMAWARAMGVGEVSGK